MEGKKYISHQLNGAFSEFKQFKKKQAFLNSPVYEKHRDQILEVLESVEFDNTQSVGLDKETLTICSWNIERGKELEGIKSYIAESTQFQSVDILFLVEADNGMGRSNNKNVPKELAEYLGFNYCFVPSYLVLGKGAIGENNHNERNTTALHGTAILSRFRLQDVKKVLLPPVKEVFHSSEKRLGQKAGVVASVEVSGKRLALGTAHLDLSSSARQRKEQLQTLIEGLDEADVQIIGGDWNTSTFNMNNMFALLSQMLTKLCTVGFAGSINYHMIPDKKYDNFLFDMLLKKGFNFNSFNDRSKGSIRFDINDGVMHEKTKTHLPNFLVRELKRRLKPWNGVISLRVDWFAGKGKCRPNNPSVIEKPKWNNRLLSDHDPIFVDIIL